MDSESNLLRWYRIDLNPAPWAVGPIQSKKTSTGKRSAFMGKNVGLATYQEGVRSSLARQNPTKIEGPFRMRLWFWRAIESYTTPQARTARSHEADVTNMQKAFEDACHGVLYANDKENRDVHSVLVEQNDLSTGLIIMSIEPIAIGDIGKTVLEIPDRMFIDPDQPVLEFEEDTNAWPPVRRPDEPVHETWHDLAGG